VSLKDLVAQHLAAVPETGYGAATLVRVTPGTRGGTLTDGNNPTTTSYACTARMGSRTSTVVAGAALARVQSPTIVILRASLPADVRPKVGDSVIRNGVTYSITTDGVTSRGGDEAVYECAVRGAGG
jgi:hypothetical protein